MGVAQRLKTYLALAQRASDEHGVAVLTQLRELRQLRRSLGRIGPADYYNYRLFDPQLSLADKGRFAGWRMEAVLDALNDRHWACLGLDKVLTTALLDAQGLRCTETLAIYSPMRPRLLQQATALTHEAQLQDWLRDGRNYPFFSKPAASGFGRGACFALRYDAASDSIEQRNGERLPVSGFELHRSDHEQLGYLFQRPVEPDATLRPALGDIVTSLRIMLLCDEQEGPLIHRVFWKLPTGRNMQDNYNDGRGGNLAAAVDLHSGRIQRVINGSGLDLRELREHPDSGADLHTLSIPGWAEVQAFVARAALLFPKLRYQQWDIALSAQGPLALELNLFGTGGSELSQLLYRRGLLDETLCRFLLRRGLLPGPTA